MTLKQFKNNEIIQGDFFIGPKLDSTHEHLVISSMVMNYKLYTPTNSTAYPELSTYSEINAFNPDGSIKTVTNLKESVKINIKISSMKFKKAADEIHSQISE
jgi:hypothetical protein